MNFEVIFSVCSTLAMIGWIALIVSPKRWRWLLATTGLIIPGTLAIIYAALILPSFGDSEGGFGSLAAVRLLFASDAALLAGWLHYLAFDLAIGTYIAMTSDRLGILRLVQVPILLLTFLLGPIGYLLFMLMRAITNKKTLNADV
ncbi:MAG: ABA4-like family protein [Pseudomonadota bacterium]